MKVGARNRIVGTVSSISKGKLMCLVKVEVPARSRMASVMTIESLKAWASAKETGSRSLLRR